MRNYRGPGKEIQWTNTGAAVVSGQVVPLGAMIGVAVADIPAVGAAGTGALKVAGECELPATSANTWAAGDILYWNAGTGMLTSVAQALVAGHASKPKIALATTACVILGKTVLTSIADAIVTASIAGSDSSLDIVGLAAAAGGAVPIAGGAGSGGVGGLVSLTGGQGSAGQVGGAVNITGGTSASGNAIGGAASITGGRGSGTQVGGAVSLIAGAGGSGAGTGAGGTVTITGGGGAATSGAGGAIAMTGGAGVATAAGGAVTITGGGSGVGNTGNGGALALAGGAALSVAGTGGAVTVTGGLATTTGVGGAVTITGGGGAAGGTAGAVSIDAGAPNGGTGAGISIGATNAISVTVGGTSIPMVSGGPQTRGIGASTAAAGTDHTDAGVLPAGTAGVYPTTGATDATGVQINDADKVTGRMILIGNGVPNKTLKVYPAHNGTVNGAAADVAFSSVSGKGVIAVCLSSGANTWLMW